MLYWYNLTQLTYLSHYHQYHVSTILREVFAASTNSSKFVRRPKVRWPFSSFFGKRGWLNFFHQYRDFSIGAINVTDFNTFFGLSYLQPPLPQTCKMCLTHTHWRQWFNRFFEFRGLQNVEISWKSKINFFSKKKLTFPFRRENFIDFKTMTCV